MKKTVLRRLDALEQEERSRQRREESLFDAGRIRVWTIILGYYVGGLEPENDYPHWALERALKESPNKVFPAVITEEYYLDIQRRYHDAYRQLFTACELDFDQAGRNELFEAFVPLVDRLPEKWLSWLRSDLERYSEIAAGTNLPRGLSSENFLIFA
jgi:hypothetical protein